MTVVAYKGREIEPIITAALQMYEEGKEIEDAAKVLNVPTRTIHRWLVSNAEDRWLQAQKGRAQASYEEVRKRRDDARKVLEALELGENEMSPGEARGMNWRLAHARECLAAADQELRHQEWLLERLLRRIYGQDREAGDSPRVQININLSADSQRQDPDAKVIDHNP